jgi:hypothetical protein
MSSGNSAQPNLTSAAQRADVLALFGGIIFSVGFAALIWLTGDRLVAAFPKLPDQGALWYYWKLAEPTLASRATAWGFYALHQIGLWGLVYYAQTRVKRYVTGLHPVNFVALGFNALFTVVHYAQTHFEYDGLAQDVSILSSQGSVIILLVLVLLMENPRRGLFFGKRAPLSQEVVQFVRKYHGYFFAWAVVYTFWYHPMENTTGHLLGFLYTSLLMLQGSLFFTRIHINKWWTFAQEFLVLVHGTLVAVNQGAGMWPMFLFGFGGIFIITQMHGLGLSRLVRWGLLAVYAVAVTTVYAGRGLGQLNEVIRIPAIDYLLVFLLAWLIGGGLWIARRVRAARPELLVFDAMSVPVTTEAENDR